MRVFEEHEEYKNLTQANLAISMLHSESNFKTRIIQTLLTVMAMQAVLIVVLIFQLTGGLQ